MSGENAIPCIPIPDIQEPVLPFPFKAQQELPSVTAAANICCIRIGFATPPIPLSFFIATPALVTAFRAGFAALREFKRSIPVKCPRQP